MPAKHSVKVPGQPDDAYESEISIVKSEQPYVRVRVQGVLTKKSTVEFFSAAARVAKKHNTRRFLLDLYNARSVTSVADDYEIAYRELENIGIARGSKLALLLGSQSVADVFFAVVAHNAGYICETFSDKAVAEKWLQS